MRYLVMTIGMWKTMYPLPIAIKYILFRWIFNF